MNSPWRILLAFPGGELTLHQYKRDVPDHDMTRKAASLAGGLFKSWEWASDPEIPAIEAHDSPAMILCVRGPAAVDCHL